MLRRLFRFFSGKRKPRAGEPSDVWTQASEIKAFVREAASELDGHRPSADDITQVAETCKAAITETTDQTVLALKALDAKRAAAGTVFRLMQATYRVFRKAKLPDPMNTVLLVIPFWLLEGGMAGAILISEGRMDLVAGITYGLIFALVNILLGVLIGYLPLRYIAYRTPIDLTEPDAEPGLSRTTLLIRGFAAFGLVIGLAAEAVLIFGAARLRSLGTHEGVFAFSEIGFWETFDDSLAIIVVVIGTCSVILAVLKGYSGLSDPIPGYGEAYLAATADMDDAAEDLALAAEDTIDAQGDAAMDQADDMIAEAKDRPAQALENLNRAARLIDDHNDAVRAEQERLRTRAKKSRGLAGFITNGTPKTSIEAELSALDGLILPNIDARIAAFRAEYVADFVPAQAAVAGLEAARERCLAKIRAALAEFMVSAPNLDALIDEGDDNGFVQI